MSVDYVTVYLHIQALELDSLECMQDYTTPSAPGQLLKCALIVTNTVCLESDTPLAEQLKQVRRSRLAGEEARLTRLTGSASLASPSGRRGGAATLSSSPPLPPQSDLPPPHRR